MTRSLWSLPPVTKIIGDVKREYLLGVHCPWVSDSTLDADFGKATSDPMAEMDAWIIRDDGGIIEHLTYAPADDVGWGKAGWQRALADFIQRSGIRLKAGSMHESGLTTSDDGNRLWHYGQNCRSFSTLPAPENWVQALAWNPSIFRRKPRCGSR